MDKTDNTKIMKKKAKEILIAIKSSMTKSGFDKVAGMLGEMVNMHNDLDIERIGAEYSCEAMIYAMRNGKGENFLAMIDRERAMIKEGESE